MSEILSIGTYLRFLFTPMQHGPSVSSLYLHLHKLYIFRLLIRLFNGTPVASVLACIKTTVSLPLGPSFYTNEQ